MNKIGVAEEKLLKEIYKDNLDYALKKLENNYPIQYLIGYVDFYNLKIKVDERVLIPRFETELLGELTLNFLQKKNYKNILDMGCGSGVLAILLKKNTNLEVDACDISEDALTLAQENARDNQVTINFYKMDILHDKLSKKYDCLISNPPYVRRDEYVDEEVKYEPKIAIYADKNGLEFYEKIIMLAHESLNMGGSIILEIGSSQAEEISAMVLKVFREAKITIKKDYNNYNRFMFIET